MTFDMAFRWPLYGVMNGLKSEHIGACVVYVDGVVSARLISHYGSTAP